METARANPNTYKAYRHNIIKGELSRQISGLVKLKLRIDKEKENHIGRVRGAKQRLAMVENTYRRKS